MLTDGLIDSICTINSKYTELDFSKESLSSVIYYLKLSHGNCMNLDQYAINRGVLQVMQIKCFHDSISWSHV